jgi:ketosteroid isomerase-like protein
MYDVHDELMLIEEELAAGSADAYRRHLTADATVVVPGAVMGRDECAEAIGATAPWDEHTIADARTIAVTPDSAVLTYRWRSRRGDDEYAAVMSSVYARREGSWRLVLHQQTPDPA